MAPAKRAGLPAIASRSGDPPGIARPQPRRTGAGGPVIPETLIYIIEIPMIPGTQAPFQGFKPVLIAFALQRNGPHKRLCPTPSMIFRTYPSTIFRSYPSTICRSYGAGGAGRGTEFTECLCFFVRSRSRSGPAKSLCPSGKVAYVVSPSTQFGQIGCTHHLMCRQKDISLPRIAGLRILIWRHLPPNQKITPSVSSVSSSDRRERARD